MENNIEYEYAVIGNDNDSAKSWIAKPYEFTDKTFKTTTICSKNRHNHYNFHIEDYKFYIIKPKYLLSLSYNKTPHPMNPKYLGRNSFIFLNKPEK